MLTEPHTRTYRPRQLVLHVTEEAYIMVHLMAQKRGTTKAVVLREIFNAGLKALPALEDA